MIKVNLDLLVFPLQMRKREYFQYAQVDFDFGQVHIIWWLSYCQVGEKISVEPCVVWLILEVSRYIWNWHLQD